MKAIDFIQNFAANVRDEKFRLSSAQTMLAIIAGHHRHSTITESTKLHANTVTNILKDLINQRYIKRFGTEKPYVYRATESGNLLGQRLLKKQEPAPTLPIYPSLWKKIY
ncbi:MAG: hypothetical protein RR250_00285 [Akkermansia sp.]